MKVFTCTSFNGHFPVGTAAVVVAETALDAVRVLKAALAQAELPDDEGLVTQNTMIEVDLTSEHATILCDGNY